jgi:hypothetical protein
VTFADEPAPVPDEPGGRPPTVLLPEGVDQLTVRTFARSAREYVNIQPVEIGAVEEYGGCDIDDVGDLTAVRPRMAVPIDTSSPGDWPWDPDFDRMELWVFALKPDTQYVICIYWVDTTGAGSVVTYLEEHPVTTASARRPRILLSRWDTFNLGSQGPPVSTPERFEVRIPWCGGSWTHTWPGLGLSDRPHDLVCQGDFVSAVVSRGGFYVDSLLVYEDLGENPPAHDRAWVDVDPALFFCEVDCDEELLVGLGLPVVEHEYVGDEDRRSGREILDYPAGRFSLRLVFEDMVAAPHDWVLGAVRVTDSGDAIVPIPTKWVSVGRFGEQGDPVPTDSGSYSVSRGFSVASADGTPFSLTARSDSPADTPGSPCVPGGSGIISSYVSETPASVHNFVIDGLCIGAPYDLVLEATDDEGNVFGVLDSTYPVAPARYFFDTSEVSDTRPLWYAMDIEAQATLGPAIELEDPVGDRACWSLSGLGVGSVESYEASDWRVDPNRDPVSGTRRQLWEEANWLILGMFESPARVYTFQPWLGDAPTATSTPTIFFQPVDNSAGAAEMTRISLAIGKGIITGRDCRSEYLPVRSTGGWVPLNDLLEGVMFYPADDDFPWLWVRASNVRTVGR